MKLDVEPRFSVSEGQSAAVLESMAAGVPVIAHSIPGNNFIVHNETGLKFNTVDELANCLKTLFANRNSRAEIGKKARSYIQTNHSFDMEKDFYRKLLL